MFFKNTYYFWNRMCWDSRFARMKATQFCFTRVEFLFICIYFNRLTHWRKRLRQRICFLKIRIAPGTGCTYWNFRFAQMKKTKFCFTEACFFFILFLFIYFLKFIFIYFFIVEISGVCGIGGLFYASVSVQSGSLQVIRTRDRFEQRR